MMTDAEVAAQRERANAFIASLRRSVTVALLNPIGGDHRRRALENISATLDAMPYVTMCNLANLNEATRGAVTSMIEVRLLAAGGGPSLDFKSAADFLAVFAPLIKAGQRRLR